MRERCRAVLAPVLGVRSKKSASGQLASFFFKPPRPFHESKISFQSKSNEIMRNHYCQWCVRIITEILKRIVNPGLEEDTMSEPHTLHLRHDFRQCQNIKSRKNPDVQCPLSATHGDYCSRHYKNPRPFYLSHEAFKGEVSPRIYTRSEHAAATKIQRFWKLFAALNAFFSKGPAANDLSLSTNDTELYTLEPITKIPSPYIFTIADSRKYIWSFDIRTLIHGMAAGAPIKNPYIRETLDESAMQKLHSRISWLRKRKYHILHVNTDTLTESQVWNQKILDVFLKIEALGYYANCEWFHELSRYELMLFYQKLYILWDWKLGLMPADKESIVPGHLASAAQRLFRFTPGENLDKDKGWWQRTVLGLIDTFISRSPDSELQKLGALYVLMALVQVSRDAADALPWILEAIQ